MYHVIAPMIGAGATAAAVIGIISKMVLGGQVDRGARGLDVLQRLNGGGRKLKWIGRVLHQQVRNLLQMHHFTQHTQFLILKNTDRKEASVGCARGSTISPQHVIVCRGSLTKKGFRQETKRQKRERSSIMAWRTASDSLSCNWRFISTRSFQASFALLEPLPEYSPCFIVPEDHRKRNL